MDTFLHGKFKFTICQYINTCQNLVVALSSGQDSLCLLKLLSDCLNTSKQKISIIYIDHQWKDSSKQHSQHIINISKFTQLPVAVYQMPSLAVSENEARKIRYKILIQHALKTESSTIILGHNMDDRVETLISNFLRGTGLNGIANFTTQKKVNSDLSIMRPLIHFSKAEIGWLCRLLYMPVWSDDTNYNLSLQRSRIRHELVPYIQNFFNPRIKQGLVNFSNLCDRENEYIKENTIKLYAASIHKKLISIDLEYLIKQHEVLSKRVLRLHFYYHFNTQISDRTIKWILKQEKSKQLDVLKINQLAIYKINQWLYTNIISSILK